MQAPMGRVISTRRRVQPRVQTGAHHVGTVSKPICWAKEKIACGAFLTVSVAGKERPLWVALTRSGARAGKSAIGAPRPFPCVLAKVP